MKSPSEKVAFFPSAPGAPTYHTMTANLPGEDRVADAVPPRQFRYHIASLPQSVTMYAVANDCDYFVTLDTRDLLPRRSAIRSICPQLKIMMPTEALVPVFCKVFTRATMEPSALSVW